MPTHPNRSRQIYIYFCSLCVILARKPNNVCNAIFCFSIESVYITSNRLRKMFRWTELCKVQLLRNILRGDRT